MPTSLIRPSFEEFCQRYPVCQQDSKWRLMVIDSSAHFTVFEFADCNDILRAQRVAWEDYGEFMQTLAVLKKSPSRHTLG